MTPLDEIPTGNGKTRTLQNSDIPPCEVQTGSMGSPPLPQQGLVLVAITLDAISVSTFIRDFGLQFSKQFLSLSLVSMSVITACLVNNLVNVDGEDKITKLHISAFKGFTY